MKAIILAAGEGKRMRPLTLETPKSLLKVGGKTFLDHIFDALPEEVSEVIVVVKYLGDKIRSYLGGEYGGRKIVYQDGTGRGTAIDFLECRSFFKENERFLIIYGDEIPTKKEIRECLSYPLSWLCCWTETPQVSGIADFHLEGQITGVVEKPENPKSNWAACGVILVNTDLFSFAPELHTNGEYYLTSMMDKFVKKYRVQAVKTGVCRSFTSPGDLEHVANLNE